MRSGFSGGIHNFVCAAKNRRQEIREVVRSFKERRQSKPATNHGEDRKHDERAEHAPGRFVHVHFLFVVAWFPAEGEENQTEHVERSQQRREQPNNIKGMPAAFPSVSLKQNRVLAEESGERRNASDRERGDKHGRVGPLDFLAETAHLGHFLLAAHGVNHGASGQEKQRLKKRVGHEVKNASGEGAYSAG